MSGPVSPPLATTESGTTVRVQPTNTLEFNGADFTVTQSGSKASIAIDSTGTGAALTDTHIGFGSAANLLTGSANFTFVDESGGSGPTVLLTGDKPILKIQDDTAATDYFTEIQKSGHSLIFLQKDSGGSSKEFLRFGSSQFIVNNDQENVDAKISTTNEVAMFYVDAGNDNIGIGGIPDSDVERLHVKGTGSADPMVRIESTDTDADSGPIVEFDRNPGEAGVAGDKLGLLRFFGTIDTGARHEYANIMCKIHDPTEASEDASLEFDVIRSGTPRTNLRIRHSEVVVNEDSDDVNFRVEGNGDASLLVCDAGQDNVGIGTTPDSDALLHIKGDGSKNYTVNIESTDTDAAVGPVIRFLRNPGETVQVNDDLGQLVWWGPGGDGSGTPRVYSKILTEVQGASSGSEHSRVMFKGIISGTEKEFIRYSATGIELNAFEQDIDTKISSDGVDGLFTLDASQDNIGIGGTPDSDVQRLQVKGDSTNTSTTDPVVKIENERSGAIFTALELVNESNDANSDVLFRMTSKAGTDSDFEILHNSFGTTTFTSNQPNSGTVEAFRISDDDMFVNNDQVDFNFTVKSDNNANMLKVDGGLDRVGIGASPTSGGATLQVPDNTISHYCNVNAVRSDAVSTMVMVNEDNQGQMWVHDSASAHTLQLVEGGVKGQHFQFMSTDGDITIDPQGTDTLNGGTASITRSANYEIYTVFCYDTGKWALSNPS